MSRPEDSTKSSGKVFSRFPVMPPKSAVKAIAVDAAKDRKILLGEVPIADISCSLLILDESGTKEEVGFKVGGS